MTASDPFQRYKRVGHAMALAILAVVLVEFVRNFAQPTDRDFISFWGAGRLVLGGDAAAAYDMDALRAVQAQVAAFVNGTHMPFPYPPAFLLLVAPFGLLSFPAGMVAWVAVTFVLYMAAIRRLYPGSGWLAAAFPAVFINAAIGQNAFVTAAIFIGGLALLPKRPFAAGLLLGCLVVKPQLGLMLPIALLAARKWRAIGGAALSSIAVLLAGAIVFGVPVSLAWLDQLPLYVEIGRDGLSGWHKMGSVYVAMRQAGMAMEWAFAVHFAVAAVAAFVTWRTWRSDAPFLGKAAVLAAATLLASPYVYAYDALLLVVAFFWLARSGAHPALLAVLWCLPLVTVAQIAGTAGPVNLGPVVPLALLAILVRQLFGRRTAPAAGTPALA